MALNKYVNGAWQESGSAKRYANGAWQECGSVNRYTNGAWEDMSAKPVYYLQDGDVVNDAYTWAGDGVYIRYKQNGYLEFENAFDETNDAEIRIPDRNNELVGKTVYVVTDSANDDVRYFANSIPNNGNVYYTKLLSTGSEKFHKIWFTLSYWETIRIKEIYVK